MKWKKRGLIYEPKKNFPWNQSYGMMPTPEYIEEGNLIRIYFGVTDDNRLGRTTYLEVDADNPSVLKYIHHTYILDLGDLGLFDDCGAICSSVINRPDGTKWLYYVGFQRCEKVPYMLFSGLATSRSGKPTDFIRYSAAPILERTNRNPISNAAPFVLFDEKDKIYKMWFWQGKNWVINNEKLYIKAEIHFTSSADGIRWNNDTIPCIKLLEESEFSVGRPWVLNRNGKYCMWYSVRKKDVLYRIGYAESQDGLQWVRMDSSVGISVSDSGWDSEMICYPSVINIHNRTFMFYNGNRNGETGFGYAELVN